MKVSKPGIYSIRNKVNNKVYIGSAIDIQRRFGEHLRMLHRNDHENDHLQKSWNKYGEDNFTFNVERICEDVELVKFEQEAIDEYKNEIGWDNMYNINPNATSCLGRKHTEESLKKMSRQQSGESNGFYGKKHTEESIVKMRESKKGSIPWNTGRVHSEETRKKISDALKGKQSWIKGLTKETDERVRKYADKIRGVPYKEGREHPKGMLGKHHNQEAKDKISDRHKGIPLTVEHKKKVSEALKGRKFSDEHKLNMSKSQGKVYLKRERDALGHFK